MSGVTAGGSAGGGAAGGAGGGAAPLAALGGLGGSLEDKDCDLLCPVCFELIDEAYCGAALASREHIFPNFLLNEVVARRRAPAAAPPGAPSVRALVAAEARRLPLADVDAMLDLLARRKRLLQAESAAAHHRLLYDFLAQLHRTRSLQLEALAREAALVRRDMATAPADRALGGDQRAPDAPVPEPEPAPAEPEGEADSRAALRPRGLDAFREDLVAFTRYRALRPLATLSYCSDAINYSTIVSTIEFDKDEEFFAIAGVTKRIKVFEYEAVVRDCVDVHYPCAEMQGSHKISCVSWNAYHKNVLASSDYEGTVSVWDAGTGQRTRALHEHDKRCWSVHFNRADVRLLASGSDDARVKLWALNAERSVATLEAKFNVCCVRFNPRSSCHLAFGSADHCVHYYDLRAPRQPLAVFRDHRKAVSYVQFLDARTLVSASTDSALKLWRVESPRCVRSFTGHANEKNFVGLATDGRYVACGSENNALYVYYAGLSRPLLAYRFDAVRGFLERERRDEEPSEFVSAVCWRRAAPDAHVLLAANSQGTIKVLELV
ncbi:hypothetical protein HF086_000745 [Spodoptera exigua]|uniref:E3 ubiquitin-protein ligase COP1 n=1 Tax=Spodoptera exigua TaxID=7107 RepID=A0A922SAD1_SPOEX|nr:hypothetical protein HF086_000745 [Spodoptera exigua]